MYGQVIAEFEEIEKEVQKLNPELVVQMQGKSKEERLREYRTYIAKERLRKIDPVFVQNLENLGCKPLHLFLIGI